MDMLIHITFLLLSACLINAFPTAMNTEYPQSEMEHLKIREDMIKEEKEFENRNFALSEDEVIVDQFLAYLKWKDFKHFGKSEFPPLMPIQTIMARAQDTELYKYLVGLPKGGNLHSHEDHQLSKKILYDIIWDSTEFEYLYFRGDTKHWAYKELNFFINPPEDEGWIKVKDTFSKESVLLNGTLINLLTKNETDKPNDSTKRWETIDPLWVRGSTQLISNINIKKEYLWKMYEQLMSEGVSYLEGRKSFGVEERMYMLDHSGASNETNGKKYFDPLTKYDKEVTFAKEVIDNFTYVNPRFIGHTRISCAVRWSEYSWFSQVMTETLRLHEKYPDHVIGFDAVAEEDSGYASVHYLDQYLTLHKDGKSKMPLYLHTAETSWPDDLITSSKSGDELPTLQNAYDSLILMTKRIGHGKGYYKKPYLKSILKKTDTAVEVCVVSNMILGMDPDIRNHYGLSLYKEGIPIVLAPDDPGTFGTDNATLDWYMVYLGWGLGLGDLKKIAKNSLTYSGMSDPVKKDAIDNKWTPSWDEYITKMKAIACAYDFNKSANPMFRRVFPNPLKEEVNAHIFGRNFERAICQTSKCKFGSEVVDAIYISNQHLTCIVPACPGGWDCLNLELKISLGMDDFMDTNLTVTYDMPGGALAILSSSNSVIVGFLSLFCYWSSVV